MQENLPLCKTVGSSPGNLRLTGQCGRGLQGTWRWSGHGDLTQRWRRQEQHGHMPLGMPHVWASGDREARAEPAGWSVSGDWMVPASPVTLEDSAAAAGACDSLTEPPSAPSWFLRPVIYTFHLLSGGSTTMCPAGI